MSPSGLHRYRAERLLRREFQAMRNRVLAAVRAKGGAADIDRGDLEAAYAAAWQGLYEALLCEQEIANPFAWLVVVTYRRAVEEDRARAKAARMAAQMPLAGERDLASQLDDRRRLGQLFTGLRGRLDDREREAACLCYLHGLSRAEAAARMGISELSMRKLMEGRGPGRPGVAAKVGRLVEAIDTDGFCEQEGSLMRGLAFGILDPQGERYRVAHAHRRECPACRAYVVSLRGLAAALPPVFAPWGLTALVMGAKGSAAAGAAGAAGATGAAPSATGAVSSGFGAASTVGSTAGGAGGGWMFGAGAGKAAMGCLLAVGLGAGCVALGGGVTGTGRRTGTHLGGSRRVPSHAMAAASRAAGGSPERPAARRQARGPRPPAPASASRTAEREFGPEGAAVAHSPETPGRAAVLARSALSTSPPGSGVAPAAVDPDLEPVRDRAPKSTAAARRAAREFAPG